MPQGVLVQVQSRAPSPWLEPSSIAGTDKVGASLQVQSRAPENPCQGVAQLVARAVRDCEVVGSNPITLTKIEIISFYSA